MRDLPRAAVLACLLASLAPACGGGQSSSQPPSGTITGREHLGWDQQAPDTDELAQYSFVLYVDGVPLVLSSSTCGALSGEEPTASCSSPLPTLQNGQHTLELATRITRYGVVLESDRSAPLVVAVGGSSSGAAVTGGASVATAVGTASAGSASLRAQTTETEGVDGTPYLIEMVAQGLDEPGALARTPDGRVLIAERQGRIRIAEGDRLLDQPALELTDADAAADDTWSLVVAPDFASSRHVYVSYVARRSGKARTGRVIRFREVGGMLGEPAVILDELPAQAGALRTRTGPDGALYVGTRALDRQAADDLGSYAGKILRFTADGVTPPDNPFRASPVFSFGHQGCLDFDWEPVTKSLWYVETDAAGVSVGRPDSARRAERVAHFDGIQATAVAFQAGVTPAAWRNSLLLASPDQQCLYRVSGLSSSPPEPVLERVLANGFGRIVTVLSGDDGLYFATADGGTDAQAPGAVFRIRDKPIRLESPAPRSPYRQAGRCSAR